MEISVKEFKDVELIAIKGRVDSVEAPQLAQALSAANRRGKYKIVIDMSELEYMSSAGFRALADAQRNSKRHQGGDVVLAHVPGLVQEALEMVGFTQYFRIMDNVSSALEVVANSPEADSTTGAQPVPAE